MTKTLPYAAAALAAAFFSQSAAAACYLVYGPDKDIVYQSVEPPIDMSYQIHQTLPLVAPGATMVFSPDNQGCELTINKLPLTTAQVPQGGAVMRPARADRG
ncbi:MAG: hypothetical protein QM569_01325 [Acidovorax sp.]|uniref:hypothetical protein n=1 Tax=Acidovorax sp. TaxID=1872122 RepID=UPI0039E44E4B